MNIEFFSPVERDEQQVDLLERFQATETKIAIQKDGELTDISRYILESLLDTEIPPLLPAQRKLIEISDDGRFGFVYAKNKSVCSLVGKKAVDLAVIGIDRVIEDRAEDQVEIIHTYEEDYSWPLVLATRAASKIRSLGDIKRIATQYPVMAERFFESNAIDDIEIIPTAGSTELFPYMEFDGPVDAIIDISVTGNSLQANELVRWSPQVADIYPVLIRPGDVQE